jgi:sodium transport system ATP-binding protein
MPPDSPAPARASGAPAGIEARGLTKSFQGPRGRSIIAAADVSFECRHGEVFGLLGPNGAGKSTTLRMLSTLLRPDRGGGTVAGHDIIREPLMVRRSIGYLSANTGLHGRLTVRETLEYFGALHGLERGPLRGRVEELLVLFGLESHRDVRCEKLSTGQRQKASIARAIVHDPPVLILDEPTLGLDILVASTMLQFILARKAEGKCILFSTHIMSEVEKLCDRIAILHDGRVRAVGSLAELRESTGATFVDDIFLSVIEPAPGAPGAPGPP